MPKPEPGLAPDARLRAELVALLRGGNAHVRIADVLDGIPFEHANERPAGLPYSLWELVYHLWYDVRDIRLFVQDPNYDYESLDWPGDYWPDEEATPAQWEETRQAFLDELDAFVALVEDESNDLLAELDHEPGYTLLRQALLVADHNAIHIGQVIVLRRLLGIWNG